MLFYLFLLFVLMPIAELSLLIYVGQQTSLLFTIGLIIGTGILGAYLTQHQSLKVYSQIQEQLRQGKMPTQSLMEGLMLLVAGAVLITPGLLTDLFGFSLLIPPVRRWIGRGLGAWMKTHTVVQAQSFQGGGFQAGTFQQRGTGSGHGSAGAQDDSIIDAEFTSEIVKDDPRKID